MKRWCCRARAPSQDNISEGLGPSEAVAVDLPSLTRPASYAPAGPPSTAGASQIKRGTLKEVHGRRCSCISSTTCEWNNDVFHPRFFKKKKKMSNCIFGDMLLSLLFDKKWIVFHSRGEIKEKRRSSAGKMKDKQVLHSLLWQIAFKLLQYVVKKLALECGWKSDWWRN